MEQSKIIKQIKSVFPEAVYIKAEDYLGEDDMMKIDEKLSISWMPQDESLESDIYKADSHFNVCREVDSVYLFTSHSNLLEAIVKAEGK